MSRWACMLVLADAWRWLSLCICRVPALADRISALLDSRLELEAADAEPGPYEEASLPFQPPADMSRSPIARTRVHASSSNGDDSNGDDDLQHGQNGGPSRGQADTPPKARELPQRASTLPANR